MESYSNEVSSAEHNIRLVNKIRQQYDRMVIVLNEKDSQIRDLHEAKNGISIEYDKIKNENIAMSRQLCRVL